MSITFKARVLLELGAELISSDAVALYELIKNGIDAGSSKIDIDIRIALQPSAHKELHFQYDNTQMKSWNSEGFLADVRERLESTASDEQKTAFVKMIGIPLSPKEALESLDEAFFRMNSITVIDYGKGMTVEELTSCYLTIGTPARLHERLDADSTHGRVPLGEKGIGRLAAMRLGHFVQVATGVRDQCNKSELILDWRPVFADLDLDASALSFIPKSTSQEKPAGESGTSVRVQDLQADWTIDKIRSLSETEFSKLADPFQDNFANQFIAVYFQGEKQQFINGFQSSLLKHADAICEIEYRIGADSSGKTIAGPRLQVTSTYTHYGDTETVVHEGAHLANTVSYAPKGKGRTRASDRLAGSDEVVNALRTLGDFSAKFYWFNRGRLMRANSELWLSALRPFVRAWSGGFLVYRNGFRVYPYGSASDDWLDLDRKALAASAYKLNRAQIVGYLRLSSKQNPKLQDQTNREGFRDCPEKEALRRLLRQAIISDCKTFLERVDKQNRPADAETIRDIEDRISANQQSATDSLKLLRDRVPNESKTISAVLAQLAEVEDAWERAKQALSAHDAEIEQYLHLAGVGLMVELIAHELARATDTALELLSKKSIATNPRQLESLEAQLKTLNKRLRVLDELSIPGRQRKANHNIGELAVLIKELYEAKSSRHRIDVHITKRGKGTLTRRVEKGQMLQILDNLMSNSMYWLVRRLNRAEKPEITIEIDAEHAQVRFMDNGPGVPTSVGTKVFDAFYTTKPPGEGRGLGLYIAKRLAHDNDAELSLIPAAANRHPGFQLAFIDT